MLNRTLIAAFLIAIAAAVPSTASAAPKTGAIVFSMVTVEKGGEVEGKKVDPKAPEGGIYAVRDRRLNQLTEDPADGEPSFSADGRTIAFTRGGDVYAMRADGSGQRRLTSGPELDARPLVAPNGRYILLERNSTAGTPRDLYTVGIGGGGLHQVTSSTEDDHEASFSPDGRSITFVRSGKDASGAADDIYTVRPSGAPQVRLTRTARIDEFAPRNLGKTIVFSRGRSGEAPSAYADIYTMRADGSKVHELIAGAGSAYVEDATAGGRALLFRRDQGLWVKRIGGKGRKLAELPDQARTNGVFSSDGRKVAVFTERDEEESLSVIDVANGRSEYTGVSGVSNDQVTTTIGPVIAWQPVRP